MDGRAVRVTGVVLAAVVALAGAAGAAEALVGADVASAYVFRGATLNDGGVVQPRVEISGLPVSFGVWGNLNLSDYNGQVEDGEFSEIDLFASYTVPVEAVGLEFGYYEYTYPTVAVAEADREAYAKLSLPCVLEPSLTVYYGLDGVVEKGFYAEAALSQDMPINDIFSVSLGAAVGYVEPDEGDSGFSHYTATMGATLWDTVSASVTYIDQIDDDVLADVDDGGAYDVEVVGMLSAEYTF